MESFIEKKVELIAIKYGGRSYKWTGSVGCPDRIVIIPVDNASLVIFCEIKGANTIWKSHQQRFAENLKNMGCHFLLVRGNKGVADLDEYISGLLEC